MPPGMASNSPPKPALPPVDPGQEFIILAPWIAQQNAFVGFGRGCCGEIDVAFLVRDGRIFQTPAELTRYRGEPVASFLGELRGVLRRAR